VPLNYNILSVIISGPNPAWQSFLDSEGVTWNVPTDTPVSSGVRVLLATGGSPRSLPEFVRYALEHGGTVIAEPGVIPYSSGRTTQTLAYPYHSDDFALLPGTSNAEAIKLNIQKVANGTIIWLPFRFEKLWLDRRIERRFVAIGDAAEPRVWENLPAIARKNVRKVVIDVLWHAHQAAGLPLVQKWYWPHGARSVFCFRADMDSGEEASMHRYLEAVRPWAKSLSLFVCGSSYAGKGKLLEEVAGLEAEVGNHTYTHYVYPEKAHNRVNLELTENLLAKAGIQPKGFVGPASFWQANMYELLQEKGYEYTSSFGLDHDSLPYFPPRGDGGSYDMVEIPFHCLGDRFPNFSMQLGDPEVTRFFDELIEKKYLAAEPMNIYGHPDKAGRLGDYPALVESICRHALSYPDVWTGTMRDLAAWWRRRHATHAIVGYDMNASRLKAIEMPECSELYWSIRSTDDQRYVIAADYLREDVSLESLASIARLTLSNSNNSVVGEVVHLPAGKPGFVQRLKDHRRECRRKRQKLDELRLASRKLGMQ
jgi:hypothetical protein